MQRYWAGQAQTQRQDARPPVGGRQRDGAVAKDDVEAARKLYIPGQWHLHRPPQG